MSSFKGVCVVAPIRFFLERKIKEKLFILLHDR